MEIDDEEVNCVFCGKLFGSIEQVQEHILAVHENPAPASDQSCNSANSNNETLKLPQLKVYDENTELVLQPIDFNTVVRCLKCGLNFVNSLASRIHYEKEHAVKKRRRPSKVNNDPNPPPNATTNPKIETLVPTQNNNEVYVQQNTNEVSGTIDPNNYYNDDVDDDDDDAYDEYYEEVENYQDHENNEPGEENEDDDDENTVNMTNSDNNSTNVIIKADNILSQNVVPNQQTETGTEFEASQGSPNKNMCCQKKKKGRQCPYCANVFMNRESYRRHMLLHGKVRQQFRCNLCGARFERVKELKRHKLMYCIVAMADKQNPTAVGADTTMKIAKKQPPQLTMPNKSMKITPRPVPLANATFQNNPLMSSITISAVSSASVSNTKPVQYTNTLNNSITENLNPKDIRFAEKFLSNPAIIMNKGSQCVCNLCQSCFYSNQSILKHLITYHRICLKDNSTPIINTNGTNTTSATSAPTAIAPTQVSPSVNKPPPALHFIHSCQHCGSQFASSKGLQRHLVTVHNDTSLVDTAANRSMDSSSNNGACDSSQTENVNTIVTPVRVKCDVCKKRFRNSLSLMEHRKIYHPDSPLTNSVQDNKQLLPQLNSGNIKSQIQGINKVSRAPSNPYAITSSYKKAKVPPNADGLFECDVCHKAFTCRSSLSNHVKSHFNFKNKPFSCSSCQQGFMSTLSLQHHREKLCPNLTPQNTTSNNSHHDSGIEQQLNTSTANSIITESNGNGNCGGSDTIHNGDSTSSSNTGNFSSFDGVSQVPLSDSFGNSLNNNFTTRATSCMHCSAVFSDRSLLEDHASKEHSNQAGEVVCIICPRSFTTYMAFRVHMTKSHGGPNGTSLKSALNAAAANSTPSAVNNTSSGAVTSTNISSHKSPSTSTSSYVSNNNNTQLQIIQPHKNIHSNNLQSQISKYDNSLTTPPKLIKKETYTKSETTMGNNNSSILNNTSYWQSTNHIHALASVPVIGSTGRIYTNRHACPNCDKDFSTSQALGNHKRACMPNLYGKKALQNQNNPNNNANVAMHIQKQQQQRLVEF